MKRIGQAIVLLLLTGILAGVAGGCIGQNTDFTLKVIPPQNLQLPLQGTWEIVSLLQEGTAAAQDPAQKWVGKNLYFADKYVLLGEYLLLNPRYQVKRVAAETYLFYRHQVFPADLHFQDREIEVLTLSDDHLFFCELLREEDDKLLLNLFNNSYLVRKISDEVDETVFSSLEATEEATESLNIGILTETASNHTGVLLGLRAPYEDRQGNTGEQYRTLWLALTDQKLAPVLETKTILFPRKSGFYRLQVVRKEEGEKKEDILIVDHIFRPDEEESALELPLDPLSWEGKEGCIARKIRFIGNDYVSVEETVKQTSVSGGSTSEDSKLHLFAVDSLPGMKAVKISDLAGPSAVTAMEHGKQKLLQQLDLEQTGQLDEKNFGLARKMGYWIFNGRVNYQKKDAYEKADFNITVIPPNDVVCYNKLHIPWTRVKNHVPSAIDVFTSPAKDLALVVTNNEIIVYGMYQENLADPPLEKIPLSGGEEVIMAEWALGHYVEDWTLTFQTYLAQKQTQPGPVNFCLLSFFSPCYSSAPCTAWRNTERRNNGNTAVRPKRDGSLSRR